MRFKEFELGSKRFVITKVRGCYLVRVHEDGALDYQTSFVVTQATKSRILSVYLYRGHVLSVEEWRDAASIAFPDAPQAKIERLRKEGLKTLMIQLHFPA